LWFEKISDFAFGAQLVRQLAEYGHVAPLFETAHCRQCHCTLVRISDAFEWLVFLTESDERAQLLLPPRIAQRFARENRPQVSARKKWRQYQIDEETFIAFTAPLRRTLVGCLVEGTVATSKDVMVLR
jgi:hypothetical protein